ncbi:Beta-mannosidase B [Agyrium rufum]|nr:Beta-mannosidase B [Agyrium rufum]
MSSLRSVTAIDEGWTFKQADDESASFLPVAQFPTNIHLDLMHHKIIPDVFVGKNENDVQWIGEKDWIYKTSFQTPVELPKGSQAVLAFDGLDTHASVKLNGKEILKTENMFIPERVDITDALTSEKDGENELVITFESTWFIGKKLVEKYPDHHWGCWNGDASRLAVRKAQYHYGWDWGPMFMTCGPWRPISLEVYESRIADLYFSTNVDKSLKSAEVVAKAEIEGNATDVTFEISLNGDVVSTEAVKAQKGLATATFRTQNPELWYPHTYGKQPLYQLTATLSSEKVDVDKATKRFGLRRAEVVQKPLDGQDGTSFFFEVNNIPVFCGGSDWIPADNFIPRISRQKYRDWVKMVVDGNQVMIRVWGGGIFEEKHFYEACDEMGVLVWQDFLFGCGNYPANEPFLDLVKKEAEANVKILRHHPSIVIWAGNNEDYQYQESENLDYDPKDKDPSSWLKSSFPARYIYEKILPDACKELVPDTYYHYGSPFGGKDTRDPTIGDIHQWNVWHGTQEKYQNFDTLAGRFVSEFGMEGFPHIKTIDSYLPQGKDDPDRYPQSSTVDFHNKADGHERRIALYLVENMRYKFDPFEQFVYSTQLMQAECLASAYRLWKRQWKGPGREYCAGALVWQTNDCWPVTSWAIIDYYLRPKHAYYTVKRELQPITIGLKRTTSTKPANKYTRVDVKTTHTIEMWASNLSLEKRTMDVVLKAWDLETGEETYSTQVHSGYVLEPNRSVEITSFEVPVAKSNHQDAALRTVVAAYLVEDGKQVARYINWPEPLKYTHLQIPKHLKVEVAGGEGDETVEISAEVPIKGFALECEDDEVVFADNCVDIVPGETVRIGVKGLKAGEEKRLGTRYLNMNSD